MQNSNVHHFDLNPNTDKGKDKKSDQRYSIFDEKGMIAPTYPRASISATSTINQGGKFQGL